MTEQTSIETGVALTAIGGEHDRRFIAGWERLRADPSLIEKLNALKRCYEATSTPEEYEAAKSAFFGALEPQPGGHVRRV